MKLSKTLLKRTAALISCLIVLIVVGYLLLDMIRSRGTTTETRQKIVNLSGFDFEIIETIPGGIAKMDWISIFASKVGENRKTLLFEYDPGSYYDLLPTIRVSSNHNITISIQAISSVRVQLFKWQYGSVDYEIGYIQFPRVQEQKSTVKP